MQFMLKTLPSRSRYSISVNNASVDGAVTKEQVDDFVKTTICEFLHFIHLLYIYMFGKAEKIYYYYYYYYAITCTLLSF